MEKTGIDFGAASEFLVRWDEGSLGRALSILVELAERGIQSYPDTIAKEDRLLSPREAAHKLGVSWWTLRDKLIPFYDIQSSGTGRGRKFRLSEINRVIAIREQANGKSVQGGRAMED